MTEKVFFNGAVIDADRAHIAANDGGFLYGAGLFETMRSHNGVVFRRNDHLDRLMLSANHLSIHHNYDKPRLTQAINDVLKANELTEARLRLTLTSGPIAGSVEQVKPTLLITATQLQLYPAQYYQTGATVVLCPYKQNPADPMCGHKTTNYYSRLLALTLARQKQAVEALWFTTDNRLAEGCVSNVFLVKDSTLCTPPVETPILPGVARKAICQIAAEESVPFQEKELYISDVLEADEIFLTNVVMEVLPVVNVEKHTVGNGEIGPVTTRLREKFLETIEEECRRPE